MTKPNLTEEDYSDLAKLVREAIDAETYRIGPRMNKLRLLLAKLEPESDRPLGPRPPAHVSAPWPGTEIDSVGGVQRSAFDGPLHR